MVVSVVLATKLNQ